MDRVGLDCFKRSLIPGSFGAVCVSVQYWKHKEHISADLYIDAKKYSIFKKEKSRVNGPKLMMSVIRGAGPTERSVKKGHVFLWFEGI